MLPVLLSGSVPSKLIRVMVHAHAWVFTKVVATLRFGESNMKAFMLLWMPQLFHMWHAYEKANAKFVYLIDLII